MGTSNGFLALPLLFRRPYLETDLPTLGWIYSYSDSSLSLAKSFFDISSGQNLTLTEILKSPVAFSNRKDTFDASGIQLIDNTPEQIRDAAIEMFDRVNNLITYSMNDRLLQDEFRRVFVSSLNESGNQIHPNFNANYSIDALRSDPHFLT